MLEAVGLSSREITVYQALMARPGADAARLAADCGLAETQTAGVLLRLVQEGLAVRHGRPPRYEAAAPDVALGELIGRQEERLSAARAEMHRLTQLFRDAGAGPDEGAAIEVVSGGAAVALRISRLHDLARREVRCFDRPPYRQRPGERAERAQRQRRQREGVVYRTVYSRDALAWPGRFQDDILAGCAFGEQARVRASLPVTLLLADDALAVLPIAAEPAQTESAFVIRSCALLPALAALFEHEWAHAVPLVAGPRRAPEQIDQPDERTRALLSLLAAGLTDEALSRALGWSARTTQRRISALLHELGVTTRFQAGAAARDRGWL
jgi:sugar-specific transcriptional regulator TrmB